ncbi:HAD family hydrolase [Janibacter corallicola]|uniref:HAD family hydrolase n=1 Tax=Janibacter corallicola TaxID=415212 RepID=UPI000A06687E|nr:HAD family phosphatase [Janibacter corallicola]
MGASGRLVLFDCDGVLVDSERLNVRTWTAMMRDAGVDFTEQDAVDHFVGRAYADGRATIVELTGAIPDPEWERTWRREFARSHEELDPIPGAREAVLAVQDLGHDIAVASGSLWQVIGTKLDRTGLVDLFPEEVRFSAEQVDRGKPAPDVFLLAAQRLGYSPEQCLVVEDSRAGVDAARAAGMGVVGYHSDLTPTDWLEAADAVITDMVDLPSVVARLTRT